MKKSRAPPILGRYTQFATYDSEPRAQATGHEQASVTRFGSASPRTVAHFGMVFRLLETFATFRPVACALGFHERLVACQGRSLGGVGRFVGSGRVLGPGGALRTGLPFAVLTVLLMTSAGWGPVFRRCSLCCGFDPSSKESACLPRARSHRDTISILRRGLASSAQSPTPFLSTGIFLPASPR